MVSIVMSSGHGLKIRGASGYLDEVDEARRVVDRTAEYLRQAGVDIITYHDDVSTSQDENLNRIVNFHNAQKSHDLDISCHFNANQTTSNPMGTEVWYKTQGELATELSKAIAIAGEFKDRGKKHSDNLFFLNETAAKAVLLEICFVDSSADEELYVDSFDDICLALAEALAGKAIDGRPEWPSPRPPWQGPDDELPDEKPSIAKGDVGPYVQNCQESLGIVPADGDFGGVTDAGVKGFQRAAGLSPDGVVGPQTWGALDELDTRKLIGSDGLTDVQINAITKIARNSKIASYNWNDRGVAPKGYVAGLACCFALALLGLEGVGLEGDDPAVADMAQADRDDSKDSLTWYQDQFEDLGMFNLEDGADTLRHLFVLMLGLGMRESSGRYCEGVDQSATNHEADTAEAGLFQTSWNIRSCNQNIPPLLEDFWANPNGFLAVFQSDVEPNGSELDGFGSGDGARYQWLSKYAPAFHCFVTALGLRYLGGENGHWGPIRTKAAQLRPEADEMFMEVQRYLLRGAGV